MKFEYCYIHKFKHMFVDSKNKLITCSKIIQPLALNQVQFGWSPLDYLLLFLRLRRK